MASRQMPCAVGDVESCSFSSPFLDPFINAIFETVTQQKYPTVFALSPEWNILTVWWTLYIEYNPNVTFLFQWNLCYGMEVHYNIPACNDRNPMGCQSFQPCNLQTLSKGRKKKNEGDCHTFPQGKSSPPSHFSTDPLKSNLCGVGEDNGTWYSSFSRPRLWGHPML